MSPKFPVDDIAPAKDEVENAQKVFAFYKQAVESVDYLQELKNAHLEQIFQRGGRPRTGRSNNPDNLFTPEAHQVALIQKAIPGLLPGTDFLSPPKTLYEWTFIRFHLDLKNMASVSKQVFGAYLHLLEDGAEEAEREAKELGTEHKMTKEMAFTADFHQLRPVQHYYFTCLLTNVVSRSLRMMLFVVYLRWYPEEIQTK